MLNRPGYMLSNLPPPKAQVNAQGPGPYGKPILPSQPAASAGPPGSPIGPIHGHHPAPVYNHGLPPAAHLHDNQVEYGPEPASHGYQSGRLIKFVCFKPIMNINLLLCNPYRLWK